MGQEKNQFRLDVRIVNQSPMRIDVIDTVTAGIDPRNDLVLVGKKINKKHFEFEAKGENLALHYLGHDRQTFLNSLPLEEGKTYLLEPGDKIELTGVKIFIRQEMVTVHETQKIKAVIFNSLDELTPETPEEKSIVYADNPTGSMRRQIHVAPQFFETQIRPSLLTLWLIKLYAMVTDFFITYVLLVIVLPMLLVDEYANIFLNTIAHMILKDGSHSFFKFFIAWYILNFVQTIIFGGTIAQLILGLCNFSNNTFGKLILSRIKTFFYSLVLLPAQNNFKSNAFFGAIRKIGMVFILVFILISPFLLPPPYNAQLTLMNAPEKKTKELRTRTINSYSSELGMDLSAELSLRYFLFPAISDDLKKRSFQLTDLKTKRSIMIRQTAEIKYSDIESKLEYANPFYSSLHKTHFEALSLKKKKELISDILLLSPLEFKNTATSFGPFFGSAILVKDFLLDNNSTNNMILKTYLPETPVMFIGGAQQDYFYLFEEHYLSRFSVDSKGQDPLISVFEKEIFSKLVVDPNPPVSLNRKRVSLLKAQEAFLHGDEQSFLTYYVEVANSLINAKIMYGEEDLTENAKLALIRNIEAVQKFVTDKTVYKSFNDIKNQLAPMEKPGEKR